MSRHGIADQPGKGKRTMSFHRWLQNLRSALALGRGQRQHRRRGSLRAATQRPNLEVLEDRCLLSFSPAVSYPAGTNPQAVVRADFNGDGKMDLGVTSHVYTPGHYGPGSWGGYYGNYYYPGNWYPGYYEDRANVLLGNGDGSFPTVNTTDLGYGYHTSAAVADFNGDGAQDFAAANDDYSTVSALVGDGLANPSGL